MCGDVRITMPVTLAVCMALLACPHAGAALAAGLFGPPCNARGEEPGEWTALYFACLINSLPPRLCGVGTREGSTCRCKVTPGTEGPRITFTVCSSALN